MLVFCFFNNWVMWNKFLILVFVNVVVGLFIMRILVLIEMVLVIFIICCWVIVRLVIRVFGLIVKFNFCKILIVVWCCCFLFRC